MTKAIDFKVDEKYLYVELLPPIKQPDGGALPNLRPKVFQCLLIQKELVGCRFLFIDDDKNIYHCRRLYKRSMSIIPDQNLIMPGRSIPDNKEIKGLFSPPGEIEEMFKNMRLYPKDEEYKRFCEKAIERIEEIKQNSPLKETAV